MAAKMTVSRELANKYPEFAGRFGETVDASEVQSVVSKHAKDKPSDVAPTRPSASAAAASAPAKSAKKTAKKAAAKTAKRSR